MKTQRKRNHRYFHIPGLSNHPHYGTDIGNFINRPVVVGSDFPFNTKTEVRNGKYWNTVSDTFPGITEYISEYSMVTILDELFLFGNYILEPKLRFAKINNFHFFRSLQFKNNSIFFYFFQADGVMEIG